MAFVWFGVNQGSSIPSVVVTQDLRYKTEISLKTQDLSKITTMVDETIESNSLFTENTYSCMPYSLYLFS